MLNGLLWNLLLTAGLAAVLAGLCRLPSIRTRPALRHCLWLLLLVKLITPPLIGVPLLPAVAGRDHAAAVAGRDHTAAIAAPAGEPTWPRESAVGQHALENSSIDNTASVLVVEEPDRDVAGAISGELPGNTPVSHVAGLLAVSLFGTCVLLIVYGFHAVKLDRWLRRAGAEDYLLAESCALVASRLKIRRDVRSCLVDARTAPLLWAWGRPLVVVPRQLIDELSPQQLQSIVAHELAHYLRRDHLTNLFALTVKALLWWNPVVWWADRELRAAQELCCDAMAIDRCETNRRDYATTLLKALDFIQGEPLASRELALEMGSRSSILRRFEMIGQTQLSYQLSRWTLLLLMVLAIPLVCMPVRGQEKGPAAPATASPSDPGTAAEVNGEKAETAETQPAEAQPAKTSDAADTESIDPKIMELAEAARKKLGAYSDVESLTLKDGRTGRMKVKKNISPVAEILITPHLAKDGTKFDLQWVDAKGKVVQEKETTQAVSDATILTLTRTSAFSVDGQNILSSIQLQPYREGDDSVAVEVKVLFIPTPTDEEFEAMRLTMGKVPQSRPNQKSQKTRERVERPRGNCSISGKVVSAATGKPVDHARMYLFYLGTHGSIFVRTAGDGSFVFKDIPAGPFFLKSSSTAGYQDASYNPEGRAGQLPQFSLKDGEQRSGVVLTIEPAYRISGKIQDENGKVPENVDTLWVFAWVEKDAGSGYKSKQAKVDPEDGSYLIDGLDGKPAYVIAIHKPDAMDGSAYPPIYYPGTFSLSDAKQIAFDGETEVDGIDITLQKEGGLTLEGTVTDETGRPIPETLVVVHRGEMYFASFGAHTDERGNYRIQGLGSGEFLIDLDATQRGFVRVHDPVAFDGKSKTTQRNFTLKRGVTISGKFLDEEGNDWQIGRSHGYAYVRKDRQESDSSFSFGRLWNRLWGKYNPKSVEVASVRSAPWGDGDYRPAKMLFPTKSTFAIQGLLPGQIRIGFLPTKENQEVLKILHEGQNIMKSGIDSKPGQEIKDVTIVIGTP